MTKNIAETIRQQIESAREQLLDLSLRNRLLNYSPRKNATLEVVDEQPAEVLRLMVSLEKQMSFVGLRTPSSSDDDSDEARFLPLPVDPTDTKLNTHLEETQLHTHLLKLSTDAQTVLEEQGINTLFLALGMLKWFEADNSDKPRYAPLVLLPVEITRTSTGRFRLRYTGEEIGGNLSLQAKLKHDFGIAIPDLPEIEDLDFEDYASAIQKQTAKQKRWSVDPNRIVLGLFSYAKYLMYKDLDPASWPKDRPITEHGLVRALLHDGFEQLPSPFGDNEFLDPHRPPESAHAVVDADSSQIHAILDANQGRSMVIEGPPGTGKSQTITNLIAEAVANKKRVLFVAEKMAALEVVKRKLDAVGLGCACLELHSRKTKKSRVLQELGRTLDLGKPKTTGVKEDLEKLERTREELTKYASSLHRAIAKSGVTPYETMGKLLLLGPPKPKQPKANFKEIANVTPEHYDHLRQKARDLQSVIADIGTPCGHPYYDCHPQTILPADIEDLRAELQEAQTALAALLAHLDDFATDLDLAKPTDMASLSSAVAQLGKLESAPQHAASADLSNPLWLTSRRTISACVKAAGKAKALQEKWVALSDSISWDADVASLHSTLQPYQTKFWRLLSPTYRRILRDIKSSVVPTPPSNLTALLSLLHDINSFQHHVAALERRDELMSTLFRSLWDGLTSDWDQLDAISSWTQKAHQPKADTYIAIGILAALSHRASHNDLLALAAKTETLSQKFSSAWLAVCSRLRPGSQVLGTSEAQDLAFANIQQLLDSWREDPSSVQQIVRYNHARDALDELGLRSVCDIAATWPESGSSLVTLLDFTWYDGLLRKAFTGRPELRRFDRTAHEGLVAQFQTLDQRQFDLNRARVAMGHFKNLPAKFERGTTGVLLGEINRKRRQKPIRKLMATCGDVIASIKPVFMMSPSSVAMFLPPDGPSFDMVVFDEASQIRPEDALGAIARGRQVVVLGDSQQMPPTSFFQRMTEGDVAEDGDDPASTSDMESILKLFRARGAPVRSLLWHYRSHHPSLIAVSSREFYDDKLLIFPSPVESPEDMGLDYICVEHAEYARGGSRTNKEEAAAVAQAVLEHVRSAPHLTLGVAAFSQAQQHEIAMQLERLRLANEELLAFEAAHPTEPLFVKNLENVQGDERDVIFISVGYGKSSQGYMAHSFGPLNSEGGERRLNVLMSRARRRCRVFANFDDTDIDLHRSGARGVQVLKTFLRYARTGEFDTPRLTARPPDSPFEEAVLKALQAKGHRVDCQVGSAGFFIDLAIVHPARPGSYLLGIECDGAKYHSARSTRDRDRLREAVLRSKGWTIHRIWSTDWFQNEAREMQRLEKAIAQALKYTEPRTHPHSESAPKEKSQLSGPPPSISADPVQRHDNVKNGAFAFKSYALANVSLPPDFQLHEAPLLLLAQSVMDVVQQEQPLHTAEVIRRLRNAAGLQRSGRRIQKAIQSALEALEKQGRVVSDDGFWSRSGSVVTTPRSRASFPPQFKKLEYIAPSEVRAGILSAIRMSFGLRRDDVALTVLRLFGFGRTSPDMLERVEQEVADLLQADRLLEANSILQIPTGQ